MPSIPDDLFLKLKWDVYESGANEFYFVIPHKKKFINRFLKKFPEYLTIPELELRQIVTFIRTYVWSNIATEDKYGNKIENPKWDAENNKTDIENTINALKSDNLEIRTKVEEFDKFHELLMRNAPEGYEPYYFPLEPNGKDPLEDASWKPGEKDGKKYNGTRKTYNEARNLMKRGFNIGVAGTDEDPLSIADADDPEKVGEVKETLTVISRKQYGRHYFYFTNDKPVNDKNDEDLLNNYESAKQNLPTDAGEVRAVWLYVVASGSFVECSYEIFNRIAEEDRPYAGLYRVGNDIGAANITFEELPDVFRKRAESKNEGARLRQLNKKVREYHNKIDSGKNKSALWDLDIHDVTGYPNKPGMRFAMFSEIHGSDTEKNASIDNDLLTCWRHLVSHNGLTFLVAASGVLPCEDAGYQQGSGHTLSDFKDPYTVFTIWKYAKDKGFIPKDDPIPHAAMRYYAQKNGINDCKALEGGWKLPAADYNKALEESEKEGIETGRKQLTGKSKQEKAGETKLSERAREVLKLAFEEMLSNDSDKALSKNGEGFNKFDSEAVHEDMDGETEVSDSILIKHAYRLKKYKKQLVGFGIDTDELEAIIKEYNKKSKSEEPEKVTVPFDVVSDHVLNTRHIFSMRDNKQIYLYQDGVYRGEGTEAILDTEIRNVHNDFYVECWDSTNPDFPLGHIPKATTNYISEALAYIRAYSHRPREDIDKEAGKCINLQNGLFDLDKWEFKEHTPEYLSICQTPVKYDPSAKCPQIEKFLKEVAKPEDIDFLYEWFGYCLTVDVRYQKALMVYGIPGTGKSVLLALLEMFIGIENCSAESLHKIEEEKYRSANLYGKRVNVCSDLPSTKMHKTEIFKKLVSGIDTIDAEHKYQDSFKFRNVAKLTFSANKLPEGPKDTAFYERFCLLEFSHKFRGTEQDDKQLLAKLTTEEELSGLLNKALEGLKRLYKNDKFSYSKSFEETEREYILNSNPVAIFMEERTVISNQDIDSTILYASYIEWSRNQNKPFVSKIEFGRKLTGMGYTNYRENVKKDGSKKATYWENVQLKQPEKNNKHDENLGEKEDFGQDLGQDQENRSCPKISSQQIPESDSKNAFGQDPFSYVVLREEKNHFSYENIEKVNAEKNTKNESRTDRYETSCPSVCFFDNRKYGQDVLNNPVLDPVQQTKITNLTENDLENCSNISQMRKDLITYKNTYLRDNGGIGGIEVFVGAFLKSMPGYLKLFPRHAIIHEASRICQVCLEGPKDGIQSTE